MKKYFILLCVLALSLPAIAQTSANEATAEAQKQESKISKVLQAKKNNPPQVLLPGRFKKEHLVKTSFKDEASEIEIAFDVNNNGAITWQVVSPLLPGESVSMGVGAETDGALNGPAEEAPYSRVFAKVCITQPDRYKGKRCLLEYPIIAKLQTNTLLHILMDQISLKENTISYKAPAQPQNTKPAKPANNNKMFIPE